MDANKLVAHRGDSTNYPENTLIAIEAALKAGAILFEVDVQMNADHSLVAFHDVDFRRMNGASEAKIFEVDDAQMAQLSIHDPNQFGSQHYPTSVTYFDEITDLLRRYPNVQAFVEIKNESLQFWGIGRVMDILLKSLKGFEQQATIISFNERALVYTKAQSKLKIALIFEEYSDPIHVLASQLNPEYLISWYKVLPPEKLWQGDWQWMVYTINDTELAKRLFERGDIDFVETDDIQCLLNS